MRCVFWRARSIPNGARPTYDRPARLTGLRVERRVHARLPCQPSTGARHGCDVDDRGPRRPLAIFHADSLAGPMKGLKAAFEAQHPGVAITLASGVSRELAARIVK